MGSGIKERWADLEPMLPPLIEQIHEIYETDLEAFSQLVAGNGQRVLLKNPEAEEEVGE